MDGRFTLRRDPSLSGHAPSRRGPQPSGPAKKETARASAQAVLYLTEEAAGFVQVPLIGAALGNAAHQPEGAEGVKTTAAECPQDPTALFQGDPTYGR